jgi:hypothetical protein
MSALLKAFATCAFLLNGATAAPSKNGKLELTVDLGYASYKGYQDSAASLSIWKGYAGVPFRSSTNFSTTNRSLTYAYI